MKTNEASVFVFIASIIVGVLIAMNINFGKVSDRIFLNTEQYTEAYNHKIRLNNEVDKLISELNSLNSKLNKYENSNGTEIESKVLQDIRNEINKNKMIAGTTDIQGPGIRITLEDVSTKNFDVEYTREQLIHDSDMMYVLNDLKSSGAEAIAINDQRITDRSGVICDWAYLDINGIKQPAPFHIDVIGDKNKIKSYMLKDENWLKSLIKRGINVDIQESDSITILAYNGLMKHNYKIVK